MLEWPQQRQEFVELFTTLLERSYTTRSAYTSLLASGGSLCSRTYH